MRKLLFFGLAASILMMWSCSKDTTTSEGYRSGEVEFSITASLPKTISTYASHEGGAGNVDNGTHSLRYIFEVWTTEPTPRLAYREERFTSDFTEPMEYSLRLLALPYNFVFWADFVEQGNPVDLFYNTNNADGLRHITINETNYTISDDARDAYFASLFVDLKVGSLNENVLLTRPFGKIRLIATDIDESLLGEEPTTALVTYYPSLIPSGFNALEGHTTGETIDVGNSLESLVSRENDVIIGGSPRGAAYVLAFDYIFASPEMESIQLNLVTRGTLGLEIGNKDISAIPIGRNKLTTVYGNLFTSEAIVTILVDDEFEEEYDLPYYEVTDVNMVSSALANNASIKVTSEVTADATITIPEYTGTFTPDQISIDLSQGIADDVEVTINGGNFTGTIAVTVPDGTDPGDIVIDAPNAHVIIYGSYGQVIASTGPDTLVVPQGTVIEHLTVEQGNVLIYGQVNEFGDIAAGSKVYWAAGNEDILREVLRKDGRYNHGVILTADIASTKLNAASGAVVNQDGFYIGYSKDYVTANGGADFNYYAATPYDGYVFDGNGFTLSGEAYNNVFAVYAHNVTIKNLKVTQESGKRPNGGISAYRSKNLTLDNVTITNCGKEAGLIVNSSTVTATGLKTSGNWYGGVIVTKGTTPVGGDRPSFTFDDTCLFSEDVKVYVRTARTGTDYNVVTPAGWSAVSASVTPIQGGEPESGVVCVKSSAANMVFSASDFPTFQTTRDRYLPYAIEFNPADSPEGPSSVIKYTVNQASGIAGRSSSYNTSFYNTQGASWSVPNISGNAKWEASVKVYVSQEMIDNAANPFRAELWTVTSNPLQYPLFGVGNVDAENKLTGNGAKWRVWSTDATNGTEGWTELNEPVIAGWNTLSIVSSGTEVNYLVNGVKIGDAGNAVVGGYCVRLIPQVYNFNSWRATTAGNGVLDATSFPDYEFNAYFGDMTFILR